jgi:hypothetical protein
MSVRLRAIMSFQTKIISLIQKWSVPVGGFILKQKCQPNFINTVQVSLTNCQEHHSIFGVLHNGVHPF